MSNKFADWVCIQCNFNNFGSNDKCKKCGCFRSKSLGNKNIEIKKGDWKCSCGNVNFASRINCRKCNKPKLAEDKQQYEQIVEVKPGDWLCLDINCKTNNFGTRTVCFKCGKPKKNDEQINNNNNNNDNVELKTCIICMDRERNTCIKQCGHLGYCFECAYSMPRCPVCRIDYNPDTDLVRVYNV